MKAYSVDLRTRIVGFVEEGNSVAEATRRFKASRWTVYRYLGARRGGHLAPKPCGGSAKTFSDMRLREEVERRPDATLKEYAQALGVSHTAVWSRLRQLGITLS